MNCQTKSNSGIAHLPEQAKSAQLSDKKKKITTEDLRHEGKESCMYFELLSVCGEERRMFAVINAGQRDL